MYADEFSDEPTPATAGRASWLSASPPPIPPTRRRGHGPGRRWIASGATVLALALVGVGASTLPPGDPLWHTGLTAQAQTTDPQTAAIQQVIQHANDEQAQAIASGNPSVMSDTATPDHYQELVQIN